LATEINKALFDGLIHNQIAVARYSNKQAQDLVALLNKADKEIVAKLQAWGDSQKFTPARLKALLAEIRLTIADTYQNAGGTLKEEMAAFAAHSGEVAGAVLASQLPVSWSPVAMSKEQLIAILDKTPIRIGADKSLLFDEVFKALAGGMEEKVRGAIRLGMVEGESITQIVGRLAGKGGVLDGPRRDLANLTHTVVQHTNNQAAAMTMQNNSAVLNGWTDVATLDSKTCVYCAGLSGMVFPLDSSGPPWHISCRCFRAPLVKTWKELGFDMAEMPVSTRASSSGPVRADISFDTWLRTQGKATQTELLGPARQKLFSDGLKIDKFTDASGKTYTLDQLKSK
jgi:hypothetical protein